MSSRDRHVRAGIKSSTAKQFKSGTILRDAKRSAARELVKAAALSTLRSRVSASSSSRSSASSAHPRGPFGRSVPQELKNNDVDITSGPTGNLITFGVGETDTQVFSAVAQGSATNQRIGRRILIKSIQLRASIRNEAAANINDVRLLLVYDKQANGTDLSMTDVLQTQETEGLYKLENAKRFVILWDKVYVLQGLPVSPATDSVGKSIDFYKKVNLEQIYKGTGATAADVATGSLYLMAICDTPSALPGSSVQAIWSGNLRVRYVDA